MVVSVGGWSSHTDYVVAPYYLPRTLKEVRISSYVWL